MRATLTPAVETNREHIQSQTVSKRSTAENSFIIPGKIKLTVVELSNKNADDLNCGPNKRLSEPIALGL